MGDGHPDYASSYGLFTLDTKQYDEQRRTAATQTVPTEDAERFRFVVYFPERSRVPLVAHVTLWYGPIGWHSSSWAERKEEGGKKHFPSAIFNLPAPKVVVICGFLRCVKVKLSFYENSKSLVCFNIFFFNTMLDFKCIAYFIF